MTEATPTPRSRTSRSVSHVAEQERPVRRNASVAETAEELLTSLLKIRRDRWTGRGTYFEPPAADISGLPVLPNGWVWATLQQLSWSSGYGTSAKCSYENAGPPVLRIPNIVRGCIDVHDLKFAATDEVIDRGEELVPGDLLIIRTNGSRNLIGRSAIVRSALHRPMSYASYLIRFRLLGPSILFDWLAAIWDAPFLRAWIEERAATSAGQHNISLTVLNTLPIPLPPIAEQQRIVAEIEKQFTRLNAAIAAVARVQAALARYRAAVLHAALRGRLVATEAELMGRQPYESGSQLLDRISAEKKLSYSSAENATSDLPLGWAWAKVHEITRNFDGKRVPVKSADRRRRQGPYPYYGASGVIDHVNAFIFDGEYLLIAEDGANLLSRNMPIAFKAKGRFWANNHAHVLQTIGGIPLSYLQLAINGKDLRFCISGSAQPKLTQAALNKIIVPLPPIAEQQRIVAEVERRASVVDDVEQIINANVQRAKNLKNAILQRALTGTLHLND